MGGCKAGVSCCVPGCISGPQVSLCHAELSQVASEAHFFPGREYDILMTQDSSQPRVFSFAMMHVRALDSETTGTGRSVIDYECGLGMCLTNKSAANSRQDLVGGQTSMGGRIVCIKVTEFFRDSQS